MATHLARRPDRKQKRTVLRLEALEERSLLNATIPGVTLDPATVPMFVNPLPGVVPNGSPNAGTFDSKFVFTPDASGNHYNIGISETSQDLGLGYRDPVTQQTQGLIDPVTGQPVQTTVYGYGNDTANSGQGPTYPGRAFVVKGTDGTPQDPPQPITVTWTNRLGNLPHLLPVDPTLLDPKYNPADGVPIVPHVHGGHTQAAYDGTPLQWFTANPAVHGEDFPGTTTFTYDNTQQAGTIWYHDHAMGFTRLNVYAGLAGFYIIHDGHENGLITTDTVANVLPNEKFDIPLAIQDRMFTAPGVTGLNDPNGLGGQLYYPSNPPKGTTATAPSVLPEVFGDTILVNGKAWPVMDVQPRMYRLRLLDGSDSRFYNLHFNTGPTKDLSFLQIGTDDGLLQTPVALNQLLIAPGERADVLFDFSQFAGKTIILTNDAKGPFPKGAPVDPKTTGQIMAFRVSLGKDATPDPLPITTSTPLNTITPLTPTKANAPRELALYEGFDAYGRLIQKLGTLAGPKDFMISKTNPITEVINPGDTEIWKIYNTTADTHPIHLHQVSFQVVGRQTFKWNIDPVTGGVIPTKVGQLVGPAPNEAGWKDTVQMNPGEITTIIARFDLPGKYVWHCHILEHEEHDMMRFFYVGTPPAAPTTTAPSLPGRTETTFPLSPDQIQADPTSSPFVGAPLPQDVQTYWKKRRGY